MEIDTNKVPIEVRYANIDKTSAEEFTVIRRQGFGSSDTGSLVGVNPYQSGKWEELIQSKLRTEVTPEEAAIGQERNVVAGRDLEPIIIQKFNDWFPEYKIFKPAHMYYFEEYPWMSMNFDGVGILGDGYIPIEIKFASIPGTKLYDHSKPYWAEKPKFNRNFVLENVNTSQLTIPEKARHIGLPPYYYTQLQSQIAALAAPEGLLVVLFEQTWTISVFRSVADEFTWQNIVRQGYKGYEEINMRLRGQGREWPEVIITPEEGRALLNE